MNKFLKQIEVIRKAFPGNFVDSPLSNDGPTILEPDRTLNLIPTGSTNQIDGKDLNDLMEDLFADFLKTSKYEFRMENDDNPIRDRPSREREDEYQNARSNVEDFTKQFNEINSSDIRTIKQPLTTVDAVAWYHPFHASKNLTDWGITFHADRFLSYADKVSELNPEIPKALCHVVSYRHIVYHEYFHYMVEIFASKIELELAERAAKPKNHRIYLDYSDYWKKQVRGTDKDIEEALATAFSLRRSSYHSSLEFPEPTAFGYREYDSYMKRSDFISGQDELASIVLFGHHDGPVPPSRFDFTSSHRTALPDIRWVGSSAAISKLARLFWGTLIDKKRLGKCLKQFGLYYGKGGKNHPTVILYEGPGNPKRPITVKEVDNGVHANIIKQIESAYNYLDPQITAAGINRCMGR